jgi:hypothetical protein
MNDRSSHLKKEVLCFLEIMNFMNLFMDATKFVHKITKSLPKYQKKKILKLNYNREKKD